MLPVPSFSSSESLLSEKIFPEIGAGLDSLIEAQGLSSGRRLSGRNNGFKNSNILDSQKPSRVDFLCFRGRNLDAVLLQHTLLGRQEICWVVYCACDERGVPCMQRTRHAIKGVGGDH